MYPVFGKRDYQSQHKIGLSWKCLIVRNLELIQNNLSTKCNTACPFVSQHDKKHVLTSLSYVGSSTNRIAAVNLCID